MSSRNFSKFFRNMLELTPIYGNIMLRDRCRYLEQRLLNANKDPLTGIYNVGKFKDDLKKEILRIVRKSDALSVAIVDVDNFKKVNDLYGHLAGDEVLQNVASLMNHALRKSDTVARSSEEMMARYGGDEFVVFFPSTDCRGAERASKKLVERVSQHNFNIPDPKITLSVGVADAESTFRYHGFKMLEKFKSPEWEDALEEVYKAILKCADSALYSAKSKGKNQVCVYGTA